MQRRDPLTAVVILAVTTLLVAVVASGLACLVAATQWSTWVRFPLCLILSLQGSVCLFFSISAWRNIFSKL